MMVWLVYPLTTIVPNYSAFRKRNRRLLTVSFYDRRDDGWQLLRSWQLFGHMYTRPKALTAGATWSPNVRMTSAQSNFDGNDNGPGEGSPGIIRHLLRSTAWWGRSI